MDAAEAGTPDGLFEGYRRALRFRPENRAGGEPAAVSVVTLRQMLFRNAVFTSGVLAEKALLEEVGGFDETMGYAEDYNLWLRIACTEPLRVIGEKLLIYEGDTAAAGRQSLSSNLREMERGELQNYRMLRREGRIGVPLYLAASGFSLLKYLRRRLRRAVS